MHGDWVMCTRLRCLPSQLEHEDYETVVIFRAFFAGEAAAQNPTPQSSPAAR